MWIRSQDKQCLVKVDTLKMFYLDNQGHGIFTDNHVLPNDRMNLGYYSTKEKTIKVLDMIEEHLEKMYIGTSNYMGKPFQMPQDEEVLEDE